MGGGKTCKGSLCFKVLDSTAPFYLLHVYTQPSTPPPPPPPPRQLSSLSDDRLFLVPYIRTKSYGQRYFTYQELKPGTRSHSLFDIRNL